MCLAVSEFRTIGHGHHHDDSTKKNAVRIFHSLAVLHSGQFVTSVGAESSKLSLIPIVDE